MYMYVRTLYIIALKSYATALCFVTLQEALIGRIERKLEILREEKQMLEQEIQENNALGEQVRPAAVR